MQCSNRALLLSKHVKSSFLQQATGYLFVIAITKKIKNTMASDDLEESKQSRNFLSGELKKISRGPNVWIDG